MSGLLITHSCCCPLQIEEDLQKEVREVEYALEGDLKSFGKGFTIIEQVQLYIPLSSTRLPCLNAIPAKVPPLGDLCLVRQSASWISFRL